MNTATSSDPLPESAEALRVGSIEAAPAAPAGVRLVPDKPPGRGTRKALPYADEISRLYASGYTLQAIRQALSAAGVSVSRSTVHREVTRACALAHASSSTPPRPAAPAPQRISLEAPPQGEGQSVPPPVAPQAARSPGGASPFAKGPSGEEVAKAFMATQITNPFLREKEQP